MRLYLVRHGEASNSPSQLERPLTKQGRIQSEGVAKSLAETGAAVEQIIHSGKTRAEQTAGIFQDILEPKNPMLCDPNLLPEADITPTLSILDQTTASLMLVSHFPFLPTLTQALLPNTSLPPSALAFPTSGLIILERDESYGWHFIEAIMG